MSRMKILEEIPWPKKYQIHPASFSMVSLPGTTIHIKVEHKHRSFMYTTEIQERIFKTSR